MTDKVIRRMRRSVNPPKLSRDEMLSRVMALSEGLTPEAREALLETVPASERQAVRAILARPEGEA